VRVSGCKPQPGRSCGGGGGEGDTGGRTRGTGGLEGRPLKPASNKTKRSVFLRKKAILKKGKKLGRG